MCVCSDLHLPKIFHQTKPIHIPPLACSYYHNNNHHCKTFVTQPTNFKFKYIRNSESF